MLSVCVADRATPYLGAQSAGRSTHLTHAPADRLGEADVRPLLEGCFGDVEPQCPRLFLYLRRDRYLGFFGCDPKLSRPEFVRILTAFGWPFPKAIKSHLSLNEVKR